MYNVHWLTTELPKCALCDTTAAKMMMKMTQQPNGTGIRFVCYDCVLYISDAHRNTPNPSDLIQDKNY